MAEVYRYAENVLGCFVNNLLYTGFEHGAEKQIRQEPFSVFGNEVSPGDLIESFDSGNSRTSFGFEKAFLKYVGRYKEHELLFEVIDKKPKPQQSGPFDIPTKWFLSFAYVGETAGLLMFSSPSTCYDIRPQKVVTIETVIN